MNHCPVTRESSINAIVDSLGILRSGTFPEPVHWERAGVRIPRPSIRHAHRKVKAAFGIDCELLKHQR